MVTGRAGAGDAVGGSFAACPSVLTGVVTTTIGGWIETSLVNKMTSL